MLLIIGLFVPELLWSSLYSGLNSWTLTFRLAPLVKTNKNCTYAQLCDTRTLYISYPNPTVSIRCHLPCRHNIFLSIRDGEGPH